MHDCPECGQACDCDGEDTWIDYSVACMHECEGNSRDWDDFGDDIDDYGPIYDESDWWDDLPWWKKIASNIHDMWREIRRGIELCPDCKKPLWIFGRYAGKHDDCIPF